MTSIDDTLLSGAGSGPPSDSTTDNIRVLLVDDDEDLVELGRLFLKREHEAMQVLVETSPEDALERLREEPVDCVVSDYDMPSRNGLELLEAVRENHPSLPFILYTGKGSEEIAADAVAAGVTDYLQKRVGNDQYTVLANRIKNAVAQYRAEQRLTETTRWYSTILEHSSDYVMIVNGNGIVKYVSAPIERVMGYRPADIVDTGSFEFTHSDDKMAAAETLSEIIADPTIEVTVEFRAKHNDGSWRWLEVRGQNLLDDPVINGVMVNVRDITERKERERAIERQTDRLEELTSFLTHDLRNQVNVLDGRLELAREEIPAASLDECSQVVDRISQMVENFGELAEKGHMPTETVPVSLSELARDTWNSVMPGSATLQVDETVTVTVDVERFRSVLENLFRNARYHGGESVSVEIGRLESDAGEPNGFYVEDDGPGIEEDLHESVFHSGFTTTEDGQGMGLAIVKQVAEAHGWTVAVTDGVDGTARFEFRTGTNNNSIEVDPPASESGDAR
jgi:PAS domain S-box-containing protein